MNTANQVDVLVNEWISEGMAKDMIVWNTAKACVEWPYVFGAWGAYCTPAERRKRYSDKHPTIKTKCQVLSEKKSVCTGCKWYPGGEKVRCFDCRGFTDWCLLRVGIDLIGEGATAQWNSKNWAIKGEIDGMPVNTLVCLFRWNESTNKMDHTGFGYNGETVECSNGVQYKTKRADNWTHYAVPLGLYDKLPEATTPTAPAAPSKLPTLRRGNKNVYVKQLQTILHNLGYNLGICGIDGDYGTATEAAVKAFQKDNGLTVDGVTGPKTWDKLMNAKEPSKNCTVTINGLTREQAKELAEKYPGAIIVET